MTAQSTTTHEEQEIRDLQHSSLSAVSYAGYLVTTTEGEPATLAVIDRHGKVLDSGAHVNIAAWNVAIEAYRRFLQGAGHLRVHSGPPGSTAA